MRFRTETFHYAPLIATTVQQHRINAASFGHGWANRQQWSLCTQNQNPPRSRTTNREGPDAPEGNAPKETVCKWTSNLLLEPRSEQLVGFSVLWSGREMSGSHSKSLTLLVNFSSVDGLVNATQTSFTQHPDENLSRSNDVRGNQHGRLAVIIEALNREKTILKNTSSMSTFCCVNAVDAFCLR